VQSGYSGWVRQITRIAPDEEREALENTLDRIEERWIKNINDYQFPVVTLSDTTDVAAVCTIFETLNRTGVKLSVFELLTARFWPQGIKLRDLWEKTLAEYKIIRDFNIDPYYLLQIVSLASRSTPSCARGDVLDLTVVTIKQWWDRAAKGLAEGLAFLRDDCGVITPRWLPNDTIINPLAAVLAELAEAKGPSVGKNRQRLAQWFWCSVYGQTYEKASNSQAAKDVTALLSWLRDNGDAPELVQHPRFDLPDLRNIAARQSTLYRGTICLILSRQPRDFHNGAKLTDDMIIEHQVDDHHIFPQAYLARQGVKAPLRDCVLNRTLIDRKANIRISNRPPADYLYDIQEELGVEQFNALLQSHLLPSGPDSPFWHNDFELFLEQRQEAIWQEIKRATGADHLLSRFETLPTTISLTNPSPFAVGSLSNRAPRITTEYGFVLDGVSYSARSAQEVLIQVLQRLAERDPDFIQRFIAQERPGNKVCFIARTQAELNRDRPDLAEENSHEFSPGWWVYLKYSREDIEKKIQHASKVANIRYGADLYINLGTISNG